MGNLVKLNHFLSDYDIKVFELAAMSNRSNEILRIWFNHGEVGKKSNLILCLIAAFKWRKHHQKVVVSSRAFDDKKKLHQYLRSRDLATTDLAKISQQSPQTLANWYSCKEKYLMIDILIDAIFWQKYALKEKLITEDSEFGEMAEALKTPITELHRQTNFRLTDLVKRNHRYSHRVKNLRKE